MSESTTRTPYPTIPESWGILGWLVLASIAAVGPGILLLNLVPGLDKFSGTLVLMAFSYGPLFWWLRRRAGRRWVQPKLAHRIPGWLYPALPVLVLAMGVLQSVLDYLHLPNWVQVLDNAARVSPVMILVFGVVVIPACEELLFRGVILPGLLRRYRPWIAIGQRRCCLPCCMPIRPKVCPCFLWDCYWAGCFIVPARYGCAGRCML